MIAGAPIHKVLFHENTIRRGLMILLAFIMTHLISYQKLPFSASYQFPIIPFSIFVIYGLFICETNTRNYRKLSARLGDNLDMPKVWQIIKTNLIACTIIFAVLSIIQMLVFQYVMNPFRFVGLLAVCMMISLIETGVFIIRGYHRQKNRPLTLNRMATASSELRIVRNNELMAFPEENVAYLLHDNGCVFLIDQKGKRYTTQFESLSEAEQQVSSCFFRANRQTLISKSSIHTIRKDVNNKLKVFLEHSDKPITVSRYRSKELKRWYKS